LKRKNKNLVIHAWKETRWCVGTATYTCGCQKWPGQAQPQYWQAVGFKPYNVSVAKGEGKNQRNI